jgi:hypothetical protein
MAPAPEPTIWVQTTTRDGRNVPGMNLRYTYTQFHEEIWHPCSLLMRVKPEMFDSDLAFAYREDFKRICLEVVNVGVITPNELTRWFSYVDTRPKPENADAPTEASA